MLPRIVCMCVCMLAITCQYMSYHVQRVVKGMLFGTFQPFESGLLPSKHLLFQLHGGYLELLVHCDADVIQTSHFHEVAIAWITTENKMI